MLEAVVEEMSVKRDVLRACELAADGDAVIASNTSSMPIDELAAVLARPQRFLGMHCLPSPSTRR